MNKKERDDNGKDTNGQEWLRNGKEWIGMLT